MREKPYRALVVDDEPVVRGLTIRALTGEGFVCEAASDGLQAQQLVAGNCYDVVVTDLRMPRQHGHALAAELLARADRPVVVVLTGMLNPKLVKDLIARGVDHVAFKPVQYDLFAGVVKALVNRSKEQQAAGPGATAMPLDICDRAQATSETCEDGPGSAPAISDLDQRLARLTKIMPLSQAAFDVFNMAGSEGCEPSQIAAAIARDAALSVDVLRHANSAFYNPSGQKIVELRDAALRIGQKRIGELALATSTLAALTANTVPWMNVDLAWRRSVTAGVAIDMLLADGSLREVERGLFLSAIMHPLGRIVLGTLYPRQYQEMVETCTKQNLTLAEEEQRRFSLTAERAMAHLLAAWNIPSTIYEPLQHLPLGYLEVGVLGEPLRTKVEFTKLGLFLGRIAVGQWDPWDRLELPPAPTLRRLGIQSLSKVIRDIRDESGKITAYRPQVLVTRKNAEKLKHPSKPHLQLAYWNLSPEPFDFLAEIVSSMGIELKAVDAKEFDWGENVLINCVWTAAHRLAAQSRAKGADVESLIVTDSDNLAPYTRFGNVVSMSGCYAALLAACQRIATNTTPSAAMSKT